jgi:hypothetical protein
MELPPLPAGFEVENLSAPPLPAGFELEGAAPADGRTILGTLVAGVKAAGAGAIGTMANVIDPTPMFGMEKVANPIRPDLEKTKTAAAQVVDKQRAQYAPGFAGQATGALTEIAANPLNYVGGAAKTGLAGAEQVAVGLGKRLVGSAVTGMTSGAVQGVGENDNRNVNAAVGAVAGPVLTAAGQIVKSTAGAGKDIVKGMLARSPEQWQEVATGLKAKAQATYTAMRDAGAVISPKTVTSMVDDMENALMQGGKLNADLHRNTLSVLNDLKALKGKPLGLEEADQYRQLLNDVVSSGTDGTGKINPDAMKALGLIDTLDARIERLGNSDIMSGSVDAAPLLKQARQEWGQYRRFDKVQALVERYGDTPGVLKNQVRLLLQNKKAMRGFSDADKTALRNLSQKGGVEGVLRLVGRAGIDLKNPGANFAGPAMGAIAGTMAGDAATGGLVTAGATAARYGSQAIAKGQADNALATMSGLAKPAAEATGFVAPAATGAAATALVPKEQPVAPAPTPAAPQPAANDNAPAIPEHVIDRIIGIESGGRANAQNPNSSARGAGQFIKSTWLSLMKGEPEAEGKSPREILALRDDKAISRRMVGKYAVQNSEALVKRGVEVSPATIYLSHLFDAPVAAKLAKADPSTPVLKIVGMNAVKANPTILKGRNAREVLAWAERKTRAKSPV